jgi:hypothetical protein
MWSWRVTQGLGEFWFLLTAVRGVGDYSIWGKPFRLKNCLGERNFLSAISSMAALSLH